MYERFTDRARKVMQLANLQARRLNYDFVDTEHVLLALIEEGSGVGASVLKCLSFDLIAISFKVKQLIEPKTTVSEATGRIPQTPKIKKVLDYAAEESRGLNHQYIGTEHLLLGLLRLEEGVAARVLRNMGLEREVVREKIRTVLEQRTEHKIPKALLPGAVEIYTVSDLSPTDILTSSEPRAEERIEITDEQIELIRGRIKHLDEKKERFEFSQNLEQAKSCQDEANALASLLKLYQVYWDKR